jgi:3-hydroxyacyl-CoA dehydrogenase/enoyl-CoA hydratase/3-hydroxybutyryl-CoA epimerase/enoyl-CoA isomerase
MNLTLANDGPLAGIYVLTLEQPGKSVVVLDKDLITRLGELLTSIPAKGAHARGLILRSASERVFVAGADLKAIHALTDTQLDEYLQFGSRTFAMLSQLVCPTVAAINGAALGGGLELAMHCDALVGAASVSGKPYPIGLPEAGLKICPGWGGTALLPARIDPERALLATMSGTPFTQTDALTISGGECGLFDSYTQTPGDLLTLAAEWIAANPKAPVRDGLPAHWAGRTANRAPNARASTLQRSLAAADVAIGSVETSLSGSALSPGGAVLAALNAALTKGWLACLETERRELIRLRNAPAGKAAIEAFLARK